MLSVVGALLNFHFSFIFPCQLLALMSVTYLRFDLLLTQPFWTLTQKMFRKRLWYSDFIQPRCLISAAPSDPASKTSTLQTAQRKDAFTLQPAATAILNIDASCCVSPFNLQHSAHKLRAFLSPQAFPSQGTLWLTCCPALRCWPPEYGK